MVPSSSASSPSIEDEASSVHYAPHPGAMAGDTWPLSMAEMTEQLLASGKPRSKHSSIIYSSAYDNRAEAAAGAAALVRATHTSASGPYAAAAAAGSAPPQSVPAPPALAGPHHNTPPHTRSSQPPAPAFASSPLANVTSGASPGRTTWDPTQAASAAANLGRAAWQSALNRRTTPAPPRIPIEPGPERGFILPQVVLTPPADEGGPVSLYPHNEAGDLPEPHKIYEQSLPLNGGPPNAPEAPVQAPPRSASMPSVSSVAGIPEPELPAKPQKQGKSPFSMPAPPFGRKHSSAVAAVVMPKKAEQVKADMDRKRFDTEWNELNDELPSPQTPQDGFPGGADAPPAPAPKSKWMNFPTRSAPPPPAESSKQAHQAPQVQMQARSATQPPTEQTRPETPKTPKRPKSPMTPKTPKLPSFMTKQAAAATPKDNAATRKIHRRSMSLTALFSKKRKPFDDDVPPLPTRAETPAGTSTAPQASTSAFAFARPKTPTEKVPKTPKTPTEKQRPKTPTEATEAPPTPTSNGRATPNSERRKTLLKRGSLKDLFSAFNKSDAPSTPGKGTATPSRRMLRKSKSKPELSHAGNRLVADDAPPVPALPAKPPPIQVDNLDRQVVPDALAALTANSTSPDSPNPKAPSPMSRLSRQGDSTGAAPPVEFVPDVFAAFNSSEKSLLQRGMSGQLNIGKDRSKAASASAPGNSATNGEGNVLKESPPRTTSVVASSNTTGATGSAPNAKAPMASTPNVPSPLAPIENKPVIEDKKVDRRSRAKSIAKRLSISSLFAKKQKDAEGVPDVPAVPLKYTRASQMPPPVSNTPSESSPNLPRSTSMQETSPTKQRQGDAAAAPKPNKRISTQRVPVPKLDGPPALRASQSQPLLRGALSKPMPALPVDEADESAEGSAEAAAEPSEQDKSSALAATVARLEGTPPAKEDKTEQQRLARAAARVSQAPPPRPRQASENLQKEARLNSLPQTAAQQLRSVSEPRVTPTRSASEQSFQRASNPFQEQAPSPEVIQQAAALVCKPAPMKVVQQAEADYLHHRQQQHKDDDEGPATPTRAPKKPSTGPLTVDDTEGVTFEGPGAAAHAGMDTTPPVLPAKDMEAPVPAPHMLVTPPRKLRRISVPHLKPESLNSPHASIPVPDPDTVVLAPEPESTPLAPATQAEAAERPERPVSLAVDDDGPIINVIQPTPHRTPAQSYDGHAEPIEPVEMVETVSSPVASVSSPGVVTMAVRESMVRSTTPILTRAAELSSSSSTPPRASHTGRITPDSEADAASETSEYTLPTLEGMMEPVVVVPETDLTDVSTVEDVLSVEDDADTPVAISSGQKGVATSDEVSPVTSSPATIRGPDGSDAPLEQLKEVQSAPSSPASERPSAKRSSSVPVDEPPVVQGRPASSVVAQGYSSTLPSRLSTSPLSSPVDTQRPQLHSRASATSLFASVAAAASTVKSAVSTALADASSTLDDLDEKIENSVRAASPNVLSLTNARMSQRSSIVPRPAPSRSSSASSAGSVYDTPMSEMTAPSFSSPSDSTTSFETASSNATVSPPGGATLQPLPAYSNSRRPPSMHAEFEDLQLVEPLCERQRKGFVPPALMAAAARRRSVSTPVESRSATPRANSVIVPPVPALNAETARIPPCNYDERPSSLPYIVQDGDTTDEPSSEEAFNVECDDSISDVNVRCDSPEAQDGGDFVVPFQPEQRSVTPAGAEPTMTNYPISSAVREHVRRTSSGLKGGVRDALSGLGFARRSQVQLGETEAGVLYGRTAAHAMHYVQPVPRDSVNVDYSTPPESAPPSSRNSSAVGLGMWDETAELRAAPQSTIERAKVPAEDADTSFDSVEYSSSGSDEADGSPCTPRTPDLDGGAIPATPGSPSPADATAATAGINAKRPAHATGTSHTRTREPFRAMHYDMSQDDVAASP